MRRTVGTYIRATGRPGLATRRALAPLALLIGVAWLPAYVSAEIVYLKNGQVIKGTILHETNEELVVKTKYQTIHIRQRDILRMMYGEREMERVYIQLRDGTLLDGWLVDQDANKVIIRRKKESNLEETILKSRIRQISPEKIILYYPEIYLSYGGAIPFNTGGIDMAGAPALTAGFTVLLPTMRNVRFGAESGYASFQSPEAPGFRYLTIPAAAVLIAYVPFSAGFLPKQSLFGSGTAQTPFSLVAKVSIGTVYTRFRTGEGDIYSGIQSLIRLGGGIDYLIIPRAFSLSMIAETAGILAGSAMTNYFAISIYARYRL